MTKHRGKENQSILEKRTVLAWGYWRTKGRCYLPFPVTDQQLHNHSTSTALDYVTLLHPKHIYNHPFSQSFISNHYRFSKCLLLTSDQGAKWEGV